jgi:hypothetical protein
MADLVQLNPHENMSVKECLTFSARNHDEYQDVIVVGYDSDGSVILRSSHLTRQAAVFILLEALDKVRGK